ncbi:hypothetical protein WN59_06720 [Salinicoccus sediminis]|uniref:Uncharacterized protein n=1 Tax=Salinicoccus sediminis TaxID=1432562 RepID=A0A0M2SM28_9STAP|nr:hypothetical protein [Salinicoccus sediminis]KKK34716.1 hypothetical protein WN59_06720 [Salinicoccus sediminis]
MLNFKKNNAEPEGIQEVKEKDLYQIFKEDVQPKLDGKRKILNRYEELQKAYNEKKKEIELMGDGSGFLNAARMNKELQRIESQILKTSEEILDEENGHLLDDESKKQIESIYNQELSDAQREVKMQYDALEGELEDIADRYEKIMEAQRKVVKARKLYEFMQKTALEDDFEKWPKGNDYVFQYKKSMDWDSGKYYGYIMKGMPATSITSLKRLFEKNLEKKKLAIHQKYYKGW